MTKLALSRRLLLAALLAMAVPAIGLAAPPEGKGGGNGGGGGDDGGTTDPLPPVRYRLSYPTPPADQTGSVYVNGSNNLGQVVGWYHSSTDTRAFLYDPALGMVDLNQLVTGGIPEGWHLRSGVAISDRMVVVGTIMLTGSDPHVAHPFALDLSLENPVVDLLPEVGSDFQTGTQINENGDILGAYRNAAGTFDGWMFNPGLYGDPATRVARDGTPLDMSSEGPAYLPLTGNASRFLLNNPTDSRAAQVAGVDSTGVAFRYTLGDAVPELFPALDLWVDWLGGFNDSETFCGVINVAGTKRNRTSIAPFRYNTTVQQLPEFSQGTKDMNSSGDILFYDTVSRDWGDGLGERYVALDDIVVGSDADLAVWFGTGAVDCWEMNDRSGVSDSGQIAGRQNGYLFILTPESAAQ